MTVFLWIEQTDGGCPSVQGVYRTREDAELAAGLPGLVHEWDVTPEVCRRCRHSCERHGYIELGAPCFDCDCAGYSGVA